MTVNTKKVTGRRDLHFDSMADLLADAERVANGDVEQLGNWTPGQILKHIAISLHTATEGALFKAPWFLRLIAPLVKNRMLTKTLSPGFQLPADVKDKFIPEPTISAEDGLASLREAVDQFEKTPELHRHALFGELTRHEWTQFLLRHAELHLSFLAPK